MKRSAKKMWSIRKRSVGRAPTWLKTVAISKQRHPPVRGTFGPASPVVRIDPETGKPIQ